MEFSEYALYVKKIPFGKRLPEAIYLHESALDSIPVPLAKRLARIIVDLGLDDKEWNIVKFFNRDFKVTLLHYPDFFKTAYPPLHTSYTIDIQKASFRTGNYSTSDNPPILHRKEAFLKPGHPSVDEFVEITQEGEDIGLYENTSRIGFKKNWERLISSKGYRLSPFGRLVPKSSNDVTVVTDNVEIDVERHKTAINRNQLSAPMSILARHNYLNGEWSICDYGCGKGDDVRELKAHGIDVVGWDPLHYPNDKLVKKDIVNLGFVLNVIEDISERNRTLLDAWDHANSLLIASVMIANDALINQHKRYKDGILTSINTFQKYYSQAEFRQYLDSVLGTNAIAVGKGIFFVFKDKIEEQNFLLKRQLVNRHWNYLTVNEPKQASKQTPKDVISKHQALFDDFWSATLDLGRLPTNNEFDHSDQIRKITGSHKKAFGILVEKYGIELFDKAQRGRIDDLTVYFALGLFDKRKPYKHMPEGLKKDIRVFFEKYLNAKEHARQTLFSVGSPEIIESKAMQAYQVLKTGELIHGHSWTIHRTDIKNLPAELRIYIGCATQLYGDIEQFDLVKIHFRSGKVSLMRFDDWFKDEPLLLERVKIRLRDLDIDFFDYTGKYEPRPLTNKYLYQRSQDYEKLD